MLISENLTWILPTHTLLCGNSFFDLLSHLPNLLLATTSVTAMTMSTIPIESRGVMISPKTKYPKNSAVTGSKAPKMAVGVLPMMLMARVVQRNEMTVGKMPRQSALIHRYHLLGNW